MLEKQRLDSSKVITMKDLRDSGAVRRNIRDGVKLLGEGAVTFDWKVNLEVSQASKSAREKVESNGGTVVTTYYNKLGLRALTMPEWFVKKGRPIPKAARPPPKLQDKFDKIGSISSHQEYV